MTVEYRKTQIEPLPMSRMEMQRRGWDELDVLLVNGDAYVDHPAFGVAMIARVLEADGWRVGIIAQPDWRNFKNLQIMGKPKLFVGISAGNLDSMLANYTAARRKRYEDCYSEDGLPGKRPNLACTVYANLARQAFPGVPVILGGLEAGMRRVAHYDYWQDSIRPSVLKTSRADLLVYGMGERQIREIATRTANAVKNQIPPNFSGIPGTARFAGGKESIELMEKTRNSQQFLLLPSFEECLKSPLKLLELTRIVEAEQNPFCGRCLVQFYEKRGVLVEPPAKPLSTEELDQVYELPFSRRAHPIYKKNIPALETVRDSFTVVRGCCGGCSFCGLGLHQGRFISSRSINSILREIAGHIQKSSFKGTVTDLGGPTANLFGCQNGKSTSCEKCHRPSCLFPKICPNLELNAHNAISLMRQVRTLKGVKHCFIQSGIRMDIANRFPDYLEELAKNHVSGHLKVAPEHIANDTLRRMRKPDAEVFHQFRRDFEGISSKIGKKQFLVPYFISNFPGCTQAEMNLVEDFLKQSRWNLQQVQDYIPLPMTAAAAMYVSGLDYETGKPIQIQRGLKERRDQRNQLRKKTRNLHKN